MIVGLLLPVFATAQRRGCDAGVHGPQGLVGPQVPLPQAHAQEELEHGPFIRRWLDNTRCARVKKNHIWAKIKF